MSRREEWSRSEQVSAIRSSTPVEYRRAEILALIARLQEQAGVEPVARPVRRNSVRLPTRNSDRAPSVAHEGPSVARAATGALEALRDLERRVHRLEETNGNGARRSSDRPRPRMSERPRVSERPRMSERPRTSEQASNAIISGVIKGQLLSDVLQLISSNSMTGVFTVECRRASVALYFNDGKIVHAQGQALEGEQAFFSVFAFEGGKYHFEETTELPVQQTINSNTQFLILEALRQIDESRAG